MKRLFVFILVMLFTKLFGQVEPAPVVSNTRNWVSSISYNLEGETLSKGVSYFNDLGKATQQQSWDVLTGRVWASEVRYDSFGRGVLQTLSAPVNNAGSFLYRSNFISSNNATIGLYDYDAPSTLINPPALSADVNTLGWYYSNLNTSDSYQDVTVYPYTRTVFSELNPGAVKAVLGGNKINGEWKQTYSFTMVAETAAANDQWYSFFQNKKVMKTVSRDVDGNEAVVYVDIDGNMLGAARSGFNVSGVSFNKNVYSEILDKGYVDIHISGNVGISFQGNTSAHNLRVFNLITEQEIPSNQWGSLPKGFYRVEDINKHYANNYIGNIPPTPVRVNHSISYYDLSYNEYDIANRLLKTVQPIDETHQTTFTYNSLGQLLETTSIDEGRAEFLYRRDGQIRFSQNQEQKKTHAFSYTNYDNLGRPIESGVYKGTSYVYGFTTHYTPPDLSNPNPPTVPYVNLNTIVDHPDGFDANGRTEQNFSVYDVPDPALVTKLSSCGLPVPEYTQSFVSGNVSHTYTQYPSTNKTWYSYDVYGRVKWMIQEVPGLSCLKTIDYEYDPISGQVIRVDFQRHNAAERFVHKYEYNIAGQLTDAYTSVSGTSFIHQAKYIYNESGALVRTELADNLQGIDYVYNLNGQLKAINHPSLTASDDPGGDGANGFAADVFGMHLDYYNGDYTRTNTPKPIVTATAGAIGTDQFNGNIKSTRWNTQLPSSAQNAYVYDYNKNNWLTQATFGSATISGNTATIVANSNEDYQVSSIAYDANGNITRLRRKGYTDANGTNSMDNLRYEYDPTYKNRLKYVMDDADNPDVNRYNDIRDQKVLTGSLSHGEANISLLDNYIYNDLGQMVANLQDKVLYEYNASGLVSKINTITTSDTQNYITIENRKYQFLRPLLAYEDWFATSPYQSGSILGNTDEIAYANCNATSGSSTPTLAEAYGNNVFLQLLGSGKTATKVRVTPHSFTKVDFDVIVDKYMYVNADLMDANGNIIQSSTPGTPIIPSVIVNLKKPDGTLIHTQTINDQAVEYCNQYFDVHFNHDFTTSDEEYIFLEIERTYVSTGGTVPEWERQQLLLDNILVQAAQDTRVAFYYDDRGQRIRKESFSELGGVTDYTYYVRDAAGSVMAIYNQTLGAGRPLPPQISEYSIYGSGRIGVFKKDQFGDRSTADGGYSLYQLTDHLGNVRAVIRKIGTALVSLTSKTDYYPFGMPMPNKHTTDNNYRYAFQGQEKDGETNMEAFQLRLWDARIGRWLTVDPYGQYHSPYIGMGNNPINMIDPDGGWSDGPDDPPGLWQRFKSWLGFGKKEQSVTHSEPYEPGWFVFDDDFKSGKDWISNMFSFETWSNPEVNQDLRNQRDILTNVVMPKYMDGLAKVRTGMEFIPGADAWFSYGIDHSPGTAVTQLGANFIPLPLIDDAARVLLRFGKNSKGHLIKHADVLGYVDKSPGELQKMVPELAEAAGNLIKGADAALTRTGQWHQHQNALMYISNGKMIVTEADGTFITVINKTSNKWYQEALPLK